jgi:molecular chaperone DnaK
VENRNQAESLIYQTEKFLADNADKFADGPGAANKAEVEAAIVDLRKALDGNDDEAVKAATSKVANASQQLGAAMYAASQPSADGGPAGGPSGHTGHDEDVVEAEIVDEGENK